MSSRVGGTALVAALLLSAFAGVAAAHPVAAGAGDGSGAGVNADVDVVDRGVEQMVATDGNLQSGEVAWRGVGLRFDASSVLAGSDDGTFEIWRVTEDGQLNQRVDSFTVDESGTHVVDTGSLEGRFVLRHGDRPVYVHDGRGYTSSPPDGNQVTVSNSAFRVARQALSFEWSDPTVYPGQRVELAVESNRASSTVAVSAGGLSYEDLVTTFPHASFANDHDARADEDVLLVELGGTTSLDLNTTSLQPGDGPFVFDVVDTTTRATAELSVLEPAADQRFRSIEHDEHVGDVIEAELACGHCFVVAGGPGQGFLDVVELRDTNGDGTVVLRMNARYMGMDTSASGYPSGVEAYTSPVDSVERYSPSADLEAVQADLNYGVTTLSDLRTQQGLAPGGRDRPVEPGQVRLTVTSSDYVIERSAYGSIPPLGAELVVRHESDVATVTLAPRSLDSATANSLPGGSGFEVTDDELRALTASRDRVALGDRLVFRFDVSGLFGHLLASGETMSSVRDARAEGIALSLDRLSGNAAESVQLERVDATVVADGDADSLYLVVRTDRSGTQRIEAGEYRATLAIEGVSAKHDGYSTRRGHDGYPYLSPGRTEVASTTVVLAEPAASIEVPEETAEMADRAAYLTPEGVLTVEGRSTMAPGTTLTVVASSTEFAWDTRTTASVRANGTWTAGAGLADAPGDEFEVSVDAGQQALATRTVTVSPAPPDAGQGADSTGENGDGKSDESGVSDDGPSGDGVSVAGWTIPGFGRLTRLAVPVGGGVGGLAVVWGAWRFVIRRLIL